MVIKHGLSHTGIVPLLIMVIAIPLITGCAGKSPEEVVALVFVAGTQGDMTGAKKYCTDSFSSKYMSGSEQFDEMIADMPDVGDNTPTVDDFVEMLEVSIDGNTAKVWIHGASFTKYVLVKQGGRWKIDDMEIDYGAMGDMLKGMGMGD